MTQAQWESLILTVLKVLGGTAAGGVLFSKLGIDTANLPALVAALGGIVAAAATAWSLIGHTDKNTVAAVAAMPNVVAVTTTSTPAGKALADAVPSESVQPAGSVKAVTLANAMGPKPTT